MIVRLMRRLLRQRRHLSLKPFSLTELTPSVIVVPLSIIVYAYTSSSRLAFIVCLSVLSIYILCYGERKRHVVTMNILVFLKA